MISRDSSPASAMRWGRWDRAPLENVAVHDDRSGKLPLAAALFAGPDVDDQGTAGIEHRQLVDGRSVGQITSGLLERCVDPGTGHVWSLAPCRRHSVELGELSEVRAGA